MSRYQWLVLIIASAGWMFDAYEGQVFNITRNDLLTDVLHAAHDAPEVRRYGDVFLGVFLGRRGLRWHPLRLAGRPLGTQAGDGGHDSVLFRVRRADLLRHAIVAGGIAAVPGGDGRGGRVVRSGRAGGRGLSRNTPGPTPRASFMPPVAWARCWRRSPGWRWASIGDMPT